MNTLDNGIDNSLQFIKDYPTKWTIDPTHINWNANEYYDVCYSYSYRQLLKLYNESNKNAKIIQEHIMNKLKNKILIDLWCWSYEANVSALAYQSNAKAYVGIDVNVNSTEYDIPEITWFLIEQYNLAEDVKSHTTLFKNIFDNFENFLEKAPNQAWYNFSINGLELTNSLWSIKKHLPRLMLPGNIILANTTENIDIFDVLVGPHKHTEIVEISGFDSLHIYEKLDRKLYSWKETIQEELKLILED